MVEATFRARGYELDERGNVHHLVYVRWFQEAAYHASQDVVTVSSQSFQADGVLHWAHVITRENEILVEAKSISQVIN